MENNFKGQKEFAVFGDLSKQFSAVQIIKSMLNDMFGKEVDNVQLNRDVFYIYDESGKDVQMMIGDTKVTLSPKEQGAIAVLRYATKRGLKDVSSAIIDNANKIFNKDFYNRYFVKTDWEWSPIHLEIAKMINDVNK